MNTDFVILILGLIAGISILAKRFAISYTPLLVIVGLILGLWKVFPQFRLSPELLLTVLLPPLIFEGALRISYENLKKVYWGISFLAGPGVVISVLILGPLFHWLLSIPTPVAYLFAALISTTDPVAVLHNLKSLKIDKKLTTLVEGESLLNDGTALAIFTAILLSMQTTHWSAWGTILSLFSTTLGGLAAGALLGILFNYLTKIHEDTEIRITLSTVLAYASYIVAGYLHVSGILSVVAAGIVYGNLPPAYGHHDSDKALWGFWSYAAFLANSIVFLLIGTQIDSRDVLTYWQPILITYGLLLVVRLIIVYAAYWTSQRLDHRFERSWFWLTWWSGLRGALPVALAIGLLYNVPQGRQIYFVTLGVAFVFLFVNGLSTNIWAKKLNLIETEETV